MAKRSLEQRFWEKVSDGSYEDCWLWTAGRHAAGYGVFNVANGQPRRAHRVAYELVIGEIPPGLQLDHLCRVRACVNPWHLEPVTNRVNTVRGVGPQLARERGLAKSHCVNGHPLSGANVRVNAHGHRICRTCKREFTRKSLPSPGARVRGPRVAILRQVGYAAELACGHTVVRTNGKGAKSACCPSCDRDGFEPAEKRMA